MIVSVVGAFPFEKCEVLRMLFKIFLHRNCRHIAVSAVLTVPGGTEVTVEHIVKKSVVAPDVERDCRDFGKTVLFRDGYFPFFENGKTFIFFAGIKHFSAAELTQELRCSNVIALFFGVNGIAFAVTGIAAVEEDIFVSCFNAVFSDFQSGLCSESFYITQKNGRCTFMSGFPDDGQLCSC